MDAELAVVGAGVVGCATALALTRKGASVVVLEAEREPALAASGTNSGILHTGFDSIPGELETELILRSAALRAEMLPALGVPALRCGAVLRPLHAGDRDVIAALARNAQLSGVEVALGNDGTLEVPGETVTDPIAYTLALATAAVHQGAGLSTGLVVSSIRRRDGGFVLESAGGETVRCRTVVNCAGLHADRVARLVGDGSFEIYPRKGEFLVFDPRGETLERILLPVPTKMTKGVLVFPTVDGKVIAGPTAVDQEDRRDWSVRPEAADEILPKATAMWPPLEGAEPIAAYAGLRPAGRTVNYLIEPSRACDRFVNVAAIRSTGLTASLGIGEHVCGIVERMGVSLGPDRPLEPIEAPRLETPWWRRAAEHRPA